MYIPINQRREQTVHLILFVNLVGCGWYLVVTLFFNFVAKLIFMIDIYFTVPFTNYYVFIVYLGFSVS